MNFHELLQAELARRQTGNRRYSLRAFAHHLGIGSRRVVMRSRESWEIAHG